MTKRIFRNPADPPLQIQLSCLRKSRKIHRDKDGLVAVGPRESQHFVVDGREQLEIAVSECWKAFADRDYTAHPPKKRR